MSETIQCQSLIENQVEREQTHSRCHLCEHLINTLYKTFSLRQAVIGQKSTAGTIYCLWYEVFYTMCRKYVPINTCVLYTCFMIHKVALKQSEAGFVVEEG